MLTTPAKTLLVSGLVNGFPILNATTPKYSNQDEDVHP